ncbi:MAG: polysaccharide deacetylase family protein [Magnetococcus sp. WYHC-3]
MVAQLRHMAWAVRSLLREVAGWPVRQLSPRVVPWQGVSGPKVVCLNYHRIGVPGGSSALQRLHGVERSVFQRQVALLLRRGRFVSLADCQDPGRLGDVNFLLSFDDVSRSVLEVLPWLRRRGIPYALCPCTRLTGQGYGPRDKVYWILEHVSQQEIWEHVRNVLGDMPEQERDFYRLTKGDRLSPRDMETLLVNPLLARAPGLVAAVQRERPYLDWEDLRREILPDPLATLVDHSHGHARLSLLDEAELEADWQASRADFMRELGYAPAYYAVPFGNWDARTAALLTALAHKDGVRGILWVGESINRVCSEGGAGQVQHLWRLHAAPTRRHLAYQIQRAVAAAVQGGPVGGGFGGDAGKM